ncbi:YdaS family helix-turn-helix protein [Methylobacterium gossipiicola]|uniref:transcriptional regulator n=1 Tax=Methylobacterium gossipiicola TaxID=582675 RepID=UPI000B82F512
MHQNTHHPAMQAAIGHFRSQKALAQAIGSSQSAVSRMLLKQNSISAELAMAIDFATNGRVNKRELRPDLWTEPAVPPLALDFEHRQSSSEFCNPEESHSKHAPA